MDTEYVTHTVADIPAIHHDDPSGFWRLVKTEKNLPQIGQKILYVYDMRGTSAELTHNVLRKVADGDPYHVTNNAIARGERLIGGAPGAALAELFKLPTEPCTPETRYGIVDEVGYCKATNESWICIRNKSFYGLIDPDLVIYWAPLPLPPDTYTPLAGDWEFDLYHVRGILGKAMNECYACGDKDCCRRR